MLGIYRQRVLLKDLRNLKNKMDTKTSYFLLKEIINEVDPIGLVDSDTPESLNEYEPELREIFKEDISLLNNSQLKERIYQIFIKFFNEELAGSKDKYDLIVDKFLARK
ncbi:hypothetical protein IT399_03050 [Candidatus Nomurabacteria bacterium]|nr:hypothetical protein [Candidatus Nomurabacteria bacterium]